jgi:hypothetical protein
MISNPHITPRATWCSQIWRQTLVKTFEYAIPEMNNLLAEVHILNISDNTQRPLYNPTDNFVQQMQQQWERFFF